MASANSFQGRVDAEWGNVQNAAGEGYVPDANSSMDMTTLEFNRDRIQKWIDFYSKKPIIDRFGDLYAKEVAGNGTPVTPIISQITAFLKAKQAKYVAMIEQRTPPPPPTPIPAPAVTPGAGSLEQTDPVKAPPASLPVPATEMETPGAGSTDKATGVVASKSNKKWLLIGGGLLLAIAVTIVIIKRKK